MSDFKLQMRIQIGLSKFPLGSKTLYKFKLKNKCHGCRALLLCSNGKVIIISLIYYEVSITIQNQYFKFAQISIFILSKVVFNSKINLDLESL